ncbi:MAG TPA: FHA domain-containing protein [Planctomycetota bacterium]|jgi:hypothetical protein|nr:FHA domain-containing protein [Planctomycetota bacterium]
MSDHFILLIHEPSLDLQRAVQVNGLPFTIGSSEGCSVRLKTRGISRVRVEAHGEGHRVVDGGTDVLRWNGAPARSVVLLQGTTFSVGGVRVRFFAGTAETLRLLVAARDPALLDESAASVQTAESPRAPDESTQVTAYLDRLAELEARLRCLIPETVNR